VSTDNVVPLAAVPQFTLGDVALSEDALALRFVAAHATSYRFVPGWGWMTWTGTHWQRDLALRHFDDARGICRAYGEIGRNESETRRLASAKTVAAVTQLARADRRLVAMPEQFDADPLELNTPAGVVNLRDGSLRAHERALVTKVTSVAPDFGTVSGLWQMFLTDVFAGVAADNEMMIGFAQRLLGYCITGETKEQIIAFFHGDGANGKSTLLDLLLYLLGDYAIKTPTAMLMAARGERHPCDVASLCGVRLAVANEVAEGEAWDESRVKELTGDATLSARFMRMDFFQFTASHKFIVAANHRPQVRSMDHAMRRRLVLVPFSARFDGDRRDPDMLEKLKAEGPAILGWLIKGARLWCEYGLVVPGPVLAASHEYADAMDSLKLWLDECCDQTDRDRRERAGLLYRSFADWKIARGEKPVSMTRWGEQMQSRGFRKIRDNGWKYLAIALNDGERFRVETGKAG
jgi:putative DNA primase/helicase